MKRQTKMISIIKKSLQDQDKLKEFNDVINMAFWTHSEEEVHSDYDIQNVREVILEEQDELVRGPNWDKFYLEYYLLVEESDQEI